MASVGALPLFYSGGAHARKAAPPVPAPDETAALPEEPVTPDGSAQSEDALAPPEEPVTSGGSASEEGAVPSEETSAPDETGELSDAAGEEAPTPELSAPPDEPETIDSEPDYFSDPEPFSPTLTMREYEPPKKPPYDGPFRQHRLRLSLSIGAQATTDQTWFVPGVGVGYFVLNGLEFHLDTDFWLIGDPTIITPSPGIRYVFYMVPTVKPYIGAFYRRYFVTSAGFSDADSVGGRAGVYFMTGKSSYFGVGAVYERLLQDHLFSPQEFIYPEIAFAFAF